MFTIQLTGAPPCLILAFAPAPDDGMPPTVHVVYGIEVGPDGVRLLHDAPPGPVAFCAAGLPGKASLAGHVLHATPATAAAALRELEAATVRGRQRLAAAPRLDEGSRL